MMQTELTTRAIAQIGEPISHELGAQMISDYQAANPNDAKGYTVGSAILNKILAQPGCVGVNFYNAYNEMGEKTLVYTGVDVFGKALVKYAVINANGSFAEEKAIVADRIPQTGNDTEWWEETIA